MLNVFYSLWKRNCLLLLLPLVLLCGCGTMENNQASPIATSAVNQTSVQATAVAQMVFTSYVGKWQIHDSQLAINANQTGLELWNAGPCSQSQMCNGNAHTTFTVNANGTIKGTIQSVNYIQWNGNPAPTGFQPTSDPQAGDTFQLQHSGVHLLYTTWFGNQLSSLNKNNRYWCDAYALKAGWKQCGA